MPLKLLKRTSDHYDVVSKSTFVISVTLLDNGIMECTLDADSTGRDCLQNISQRLALQQPEFFGLRYISRGVPPRQRWIELELPLKKQLDKYAEESRLSLGVMFYVSDVNVLKDEMTRYHYFLQLKADVIDAKLNCSIDQAISLAAYSLQAEFGDYDPERHTVEYLRDFAILPKDLTTEVCQEFNVNAIFDAVARQYGSLLGFPPPLAEIYYIMVAQQLDGYGQESYPAKDGSGNDILICTSVNGLVIKRRDWTHIAAFRWREIKSVMGHKKTLLLESLQSHRVMQFHFTDPEIVKYVRKICALQSTFQKSVPNVELQLQNQEHESQRHIGPGFSSTDSFETENSVANRRPTPDLIKPIPIGSMHSLNNNFAHQPQTKASYSNLQHFQNNSLPSIHYRHQILQQQQGLNWSLQDLSGPNNRTLPVSCIPVVSSNSTLQEFDVPRSNCHLDPADTKSDIDVQPLLPSYRPAPDYDTAVQLKYGQPQAREREEEPIYQNEIVSKIHCIDLREREIQRPKLLPTQNSMPVPAISNELYQKDSSQASSLSYLNKPPPPYPGTSQSSNVTNPHEQKLCPSSSSSTMYNHGTTKSRTSFNAHSEVLKQISSDLYNRSLEYAGTRYVNGNSHEKTPPSSLPKVPVNCLREQAIIQNTSDVVDSPISQERMPPVYSISNAEPFMELQEPKSKESTTDFPRFCRPIDSNIMKEFQSIQKAKANPSFSTGMKRENARRNRTPNVLPYDDNSIHLTHTKQNPDGYINASPISIQIGGRIWKYIVGQIPLGGNGPCSFWQMIWETGSKIIVSLERDSSAPFYPAGMDTLTFGDFQVTDCKRQRDNNSTKSSIAKELMLNFVTKKKQRRIWLLPYEDEWKNDVPVDTEHFLCFLEEVNSVQRRVSESVLTQPLAVLCGTGAGRSGVFVLSDILLHAADTGHKVRCDSLLSHLRTERMLLVTHPPQYSFVLETLAKYLAQSRLI